MKNLELDWSKIKVDAMVRTRGPISGVVAVLVSSKLGNDFGTVVSDTSVDAILAKLPPSVGIYASMPSCNPGEIVNRMLSLWDDESLKNVSYTDVSDGMIFHKVDPDHLLCDMRTFAWELFAEQQQVEIIEAWGENHNT